MPETTEKYHRVPTGKRKKKGEKIRTIIISKAIKALYDVKRKVIVTYLFDKTKYTMKQAKEWVKKNKESALHQQLVDIDELMERRKAQMEELNQEVYAKVMEIVDKE
jgi:hypothetical protein